MSTTVALTDPPQPPTPAVSAEHRTSGFRVSVPTAAPRELTVYREVIYRDADGEVTMAPPGYTTAYEYPIVVTPEFVAKYPQAVSIMSDLAALFDAEDPVVHPVS
jgi:hypothetical protein